MEVVTKKLGGRPLTAASLIETCTEFANMTRGDKYHDPDPVLQALRQRAQVLMREYNNSDPSAPEKREAMIKGMLGSSGQTIRVEPPFFVDYGLNIFVGEDFYANFGCCILDGGSVKIGEKVMFAPGVQIYTAHHPLDPVERYEGWELCHQVVIGDRVWVGGNAIINPGVTIGSNSVIGSGSVVTKDVPPNTVVAGNPAKVIRYLDGSDKVEDYSRRRTSRVECMSNTPPRKINKPFFASLIIATVAVAVAVLKK